MENIQYKYICETCNYKCNVKSSWVKHCNTELHQNGKRKVRSDYDGPYKCELCNYETKNAISYKQHKLNHHGSKEDRETSFKYYCKYCDYGTFTKKLIENHKNTEKHKIFLQNIKI
jgi:hypothetical protein